MTNQRAFVAGATGFTGREVVAALCSRGIATVAHVRAESSRRAEWTARFEALGAEVDASPWTAEAMLAALARVQPTQVYALLGTTRKRAKGEGLSAIEAYERVDYGLTKLLIDAAQALEPAPRFVYLSSIGANPQTRNPYLAARAKVEAALEASVLPYFSARPSFISGPGRDDGRPAERVGSVIGDLALGTLGLLGARRTRARYASTTPEVLARALVRLGCEGESPRRAVEGQELR
jgi:nucleoside-diphosphate-sugar epimerase